MHEQNPPGLDVLNEIGRVFDWRTEPTRYFATPANESIRQVLHAGLAARASVLVLSGPPGSGKTALLRTLLREIPPRSSHRTQLSFTCMNRKELLRSVAFAFGMPKEVMAQGLEPLQWLEAQLADWARRGHGSLLAVDEADGLPQDGLSALLALAQLRLKSRPLLQLLLMGQPRLLEQLAAPALAAFYSGDGPRLQMPAFDAEESAAYVRHCLRAYEGPPLPDLSDAVLARLHERAQGRPGRINRLSIQVLHAAISQDEPMPVDVRMVTQEADALAFFELPEPKFVAPAAMRRAMPTRSAASRSRSALVAGLALFLGLGIGHFTAVQSRGPLSFEARAERSPIDPLSQLAAVPAPAPVTVARSTHQLPIVLALADQASRVEAAPVPSETQTSPKPSPEGASTGRCEQLLLQMSLGEPLSASQRETLGAQCR